MENDKGYRKRKEKGTVQLFRIKGKDKLIFVQDIFDRDTGEKIDENVSNISREGLENRRERLLAQLADVEAMLADIDNVQEVEVSGFTGKPKVKE